MPAAKVAALPGRADAARDTLPAAALVMDRVLKRLEAGARVFSAFGVREGWLYAQLDRGAVPRSAGRGRAGDRPAAGPGAGVRAALARWTDDLFPGETPADRRLRVAACALSDIAWRDHPDMRAVESFRRLLQFPFIGLDHAERVFLAAVIHARYAGPPTTRAWRRRATCCRRAPAGGRRSWGGPCSWATGSRAACRRSWRGHGSGSPPTRLEVGRTPAAAGQRGGRRPPEAPGECRGRAADGDRRILAYFPPAPPLHAEALRTGKPADI